MDDLKGACAEIAKENGLEEPVNFEVGVFCGSYITPVAEGYFEHLERIRGERKKEKVVEQAREAVVRGEGVDEETLRIARGGAEVDGKGNVVPVSSALLNGDGETGSFHRGRA